MPPGLVDINTFSIFAGLTRGGRGGSRKQESRPASRASGASSGFGSSNVKEGITVSEVDLSEAT